ncbi:uncharacterized protein JCM6883_005616 [Sporobolomyces salmoneus]|uniref:uncharacterized protein n=1 Tax=Sporobolomyces salmoneus TaxID=183962 RepID=UPI00317C826C
MKVEIIVDPSRTARTPTGPAASLTQRLAPPAASATVSAASGAAVQQPRHSSGPRRGGGGGRGGGRGRRGGRQGGGREGDRPAATVESLDQEMSDWQAQAATTSNGAAEGTSA